MLPRTLCKAIASQRFLCTSLRSCGGNCQLHYCMRSMQTSFGRRLQLIRSRLRVPALQLLPHPDVRQFACGVGHGALLRLGRWPVVWRAQSRSGATLWWHVRWLRGLRHGLDRLLVLLSAVSCPRPAATAPRDLEPSNRRVRSSRTNGSTRPGSFVLSRSAFCWPNWSLSACHTWWWSLVCVCIRTCTHTLHRWGTMLWAQG